ncbi:NTP transferase domain-containing protein [Gracilibacillus oryzae]|uniref:NTP transferase domain-containing protein n=1 Tax=Gracilibacillus oryzae TaxID=1672701 RepID=A0A7C8GT53_9BACI|nr:glycosyltransferase family protein [Gracilibacillus oryzae]KAB8135351.1 NTP transferase domain-containing protein [Gracilibacillus oryzae]
MKTAAIIQARMGSTRLPGKVLRQVLGKPLLSYQLERIRQAEKVDEIIVATTTEEIDDEIVHFCQSENILCFRGSEQDVLSRYYEASKLTDANVIVRLTSDCPLIDPEVIDKVIGAYTESSDYVSNVMQRTYPRGMDVEVFSKELLGKIHQYAKTESDREHVTTYVRDQPDLFQVVDVLHDINYSKLRLTIDTAEDFQLVKNIMEALNQVKPQFRLDDIISVLNDHPEWLKINQHIEQKRWK